MKQRKSQGGLILPVQAIVVVAFAAAVIASPKTASRLIHGDATTTAVKVSRETALQITPLYDDPSVVSDADLAMVLEKIRPLFPRTQLKPNHIEHALRTWGAHATFRDPAALSGVEMVDVLTDHAKYLKAWNGEPDPLLLPGKGGVDVRWGHEFCASVHHDHLLASLSEAGVPIDATIYPPGNQPRTFGDLLQQAARNFRVDEKEVEWSAMAFALWLPPDTKSWKTADRRTVTFDLIAKRLMRGDARFGVCGGTHRIYSLVVLLRVDAAHDILTPPIKQTVRDYLMTMRDVIIAAQFPDGHWAGNWPNGKRSVTNPINEPEYKAVIATGHHLEWLAIAPPEFHPPREVVQRAARWLIANVRKQSQQDILAKYTFYSHVGNALALWRKTRPAEIWANRGK